MGITNHRACLWSHRQGLANKPGRFTVGHGVASPSSRVCLCPCRRPSPFRSPFCVASPCGSPCLWLPRFLTSPRLPREPSQRATCDSGQRGGRWQAGALGRQAGCRHPVLRFYCRKAWLQKHASQTSTPFSSVAQSCLMVCDHMDCRTRTPGFPVHH